MKSIARPTMFVMFAAAAFVMLAITGCTDGYDTKDAAEAEAKLADVRMELTQDLHEAEDDLLDLERKYEVADGETRENLGQALIVLRQEHDALAADIQELHFETEEALEKAEDDIEDRIDAFRDAIAGAQGLDVDVEARVEV